MHLHIHHDENAAWTSCLPAAGNMRCGIFVANSHALAQLFDENQTGHFFGVDRTLACKIFSCPTHGLVGRGDQIGVSRGGDQAGYGIQVAGKGLQADKTCARCFPHDGYAIAHEN
ncbi:MAG: hypothetical protein ONB48_12310 [candidate division KSB1 bacterium]|nr:hypothetical protein [candidate division KSB1 bacterium]MDZ7286429.1 hypothetical protein [candidate division KSB1 bacterium]MDZ7299407.1 hypothetical protein [candidate division KSB1 bacterium]MDZ7307814.1 hypothetical protein [candidate division KSB1 bacterium]MDZ7350271.1 hypothetical protein [candidate division KSB1 bacterium]